MVFVPRCAACAPAPRLEGSVTPSGVTNGTGDKGLEWQRPQASPCSGNGAALLQTSEDASARDERASPSQFDRYRSRKMEPSHEGPPSSSVPTPAQSGNELKLRTNQSNEDGRRLAAHRRTKSNETKSEDKLSELNKR